MVSPGTFFLLLNWKWMHNVYPLNILTDKWLVTCEHHGVAKSSSGREQASVFQGALSLPICSFICQDQLLVLAVLLSCPLERGGSQLERDATGYAPSPLCRQTNREALRDSVQVQRGRRRGNTPEGTFFYCFFFFLISSLFILLFSGTGSMLRQLSIAGLSIYLRDTHIILSTGRDIWLQTQVDRMAKAFNCLFFTVGTAWVAPKKHMTR